MKRGLINKTSLPSVLIGDLQRLSWFYPFSKQRYVEEPRLQLSGITAYSNNGRKAFTLIELLVVVLIIGILSAFPTTQIYTVQ